MIHVVHLTASRFLGGPERQMLGLAGSLPAGYRSHFVSFSEGNRCRALLDEAERRGFPATVLEHDTPRLWGALGELTALLCRLQADVLCCHCGKPNLLGLMAARRLGIPAVAVSRGWTGETFKVRLYDRLDRRVLRWQDRVVCVSAAQARKVVRAGVPAARVSVIHNAVEAERFAVARPECRELLEGLFPGGAQGDRPIFAGGRLGQAAGQIVGAAGRLSPEKGFEVLVDAAAEVVRALPAVGFVIFGEGAMRERLTRQIAERGLQDRFLLGGFCANLHDFLPNFDLAVLPSYTEGLPNVALEAMAAGVPVVATAVGGTPEVVEDGVSGRLVPSGDAPALARVLIETLADGSARRRMGEAGRRRVREEFSFQKQAEAYRALFAELGVTADTEPEHERGYQPC